MFFCTIKNSFHHKIQFIADKVEVELSHLTVAKEVTTNFERKKFIPNLFEKLTWKI